MQEHSIKIKGLTIAYKAWGNPSAQTIVALHGWVDNASSFDLIAPMLESDFYLLAIDLPGHGHSGHIDSSAYYHFIDGVFYASELLDALQLDTVWLLGHSMGACLASLIAGVSPERVTKLALIEGLGPLFKAPDTCRQQLYDFIRDQRRMSQKIHPGYANLEEAILARSKTGHLSPELAALIVKRGTTLIDGKIHWRHDKRLMMHSPLRLCEEQVLNCLKAIACPSLLIEASHGFNYSIEKLERQKAQIKNLSVHRLEGGHHIHLERADAVAHLLLHFFKQ